MAALERDGRMTKAELSEIVGLSPTPCGARIAKLEAAGLIRSYCADIAVERITDLARFTVIMSIRQWTPDAARRFEDIVATIPHIVECDAVFGSVDFVMTLYAVDEAHCHGLLAPLDVVELDYTLLPVLRTVRAPHDVLLAALLE
jgi:Lrp/AsnC family transcriptional regulator of ectoine degradation